MIDFTSEISSAMIYSLRSNFTSATIITAKYRSKIKIYSADRTASHLDLC